MPAPALAWPPKGHRSLGWVLAARSRVYEAAGRQRQLRVRVRPPEAALRQRAPDDGHGLHRGVGGLQWPRHVLHVVVVDVLAVIGVRAPSRGPQAVVSAVSAASNKKRWKINARICMAHTARPDRPTVENRFPLRVFSPAFSRSAFCISPANFVQQFVAQSVRQGGQ